jgi:hypothetical protein
MAAIPRLLSDVVIALVAPRAVLVTENLLLRQQFIVARRRLKRSRFRRFERWLIGGLARRFRCFGDVVLLVKPETVIVSHRAGWPIRRRWRSRRSSGRPVHKTPSQCVGRRTDPQLESGRALGGGSDASRAGLISCRCYSSTR